MHIMEKVLSLAEPYLKGKNITVIDGVIGAQYLGVTLSTGRSHCVLALWEDVPIGDDLVPPEGFVGRDAWEIAQWALYGSNDIRRGLGIAVLNAASPFYDDPRYTDFREDFLQDPDPDMVLGMIGYMPPKVKVYSKQVKEIICFDRGIQRRGYMGNVSIHPMEQEAELLPTCDVVIITGTTATNGTIDNVLSWCDNAKEIELNGWSLPFYPEAYRGTGITCLSAARVQDDCAELFKRLSLGQGMDQVSRFSKHIFCRI